MRAPDRVIGVNYLSRWYIIPRNKWFNVYLHEFRGSDDDRALHDHPWWSISFCLRGKIDEVYRVPGSERQRTRAITRFLPYFREAELRHRIVLKEGPAWTLFITGPKKRIWGFWCKKGFVPYNDFIYNGDGCE